MLDKRCTNRDVLRLNRYKLILAMGKKEFTSNDILMMLSDFSKETIYYDCKSLVASGYLSAEKKPYGRLKQMAWHYKVLIKKFKECDLEPISVTRQRNREAKPVVVKEILPAWVRSIPERMVMSVRAKSPKNYCSGGSLNTVFL